MEANGGEWSTVKQNGGDERTGSGGRDVEPSNHPVSISLLRTHAG